MPLYIFLKIFGIFLPSVNGNYRDGIFSVKLRDKIWCFLFYCGLIFLFYWNVTAESVANFSLLMTKVWEACSILSIAMALLTVPLYYWKSNEIIEILKDLKDFDEKVK